MFSPMNLPLLALSGARGIDRCLFGLSESDMGLRGGDRMSAKIRNLEKLPSGNSLEFFT